MEAVIWLVILIILVLIEIATMALTTIWFAAGALVAIIAALLDVQIWLQVVLFLGVSVVLFIFTRPLLLKYMKKGHTKTNVDSLVGMEAVVTQSIDNLKAEGKVEVRGMEWTARTRENGVLIPKDTIVQVQAIEGVKLIVSDIGKKEV